MPTQDEQLDEILDKVHDFAIESVADPGGFNEVISQAESALQRMLVEAERQGGIYAMKIMRYHAHLHGIEDNLYYADHYLGSQESVPDQPLDRETFNRIHQLQPKQEDK